MPWSQLGGGQDERPNDYSGEILAEATFVGTEEIDGKSSAIYEFIVEERPVRVWIWIDEAMPLRVFTIVDGGDVVINFTDYDFNSQPDSLFELPPGVGLLEFPQS